MGSLQAKDATMIGAPSVETERSPLNELEAAAILDASLDAIITIDDRGFVTGWNRQAETTFGWSREEAMGQSLAELIVPPKDRAAHRAGIERYRATGEGPVLNRRIEMTGCRRSGAEFPVELTVVPFRNTKGIGFCGFVRDITERRRAEAEILARNRDLQTMLYVTSHDLREPLRAIQNFSALIQQRYAANLDEKGQDYLARVSRAAARLDRLIDDVLTLSRAQRLVHPSEALSGEEIVAEAMRRLEEAVRARGASVQIQTPLLWLHVDRTWAIQAVQNLISNALKFVKEGEIPQVEIAGFLEQAPAQVGLVVRDRGPGVLAEHRERIFELFQRAVGREVEGTGAGLAIVRQVAERHGGRAWVRPRPGGGSEFVITFGPVPSAAPLQPPLTSTQVRSASSTT